MDLMTFIEEYYVYIIVVIVVILMTIIGYVAKKTNFGEKIAKKNNKKTDDIIETLDEDYNTKSENANSNTTDIDILDTVAPDFNNKGLVIGDVNENPAITNEELGITEDLYAPFGDNLVADPSNVIDDLKIEEVADDNFKIVEKEDNTGNDFIEDIKPKDLVLSDDVEQLNDQTQSDIEPNQNIQEENEEKKKENQITQEVSDIVDNTFVINDATEEFEKELKPEQENNVLEGIDELEKETIDKPEQEPEEPLKKAIEQFSVDDIETNEQQPEFKLEATNSIKLDEINEAIKNLKLEDLDNSEALEPTEVKKKRKNKKITIESVDEIKNKNNSNDKSTDFELPNIEDISKQNEIISDEDEIWKF